MGYVKRNKAGEIVVAVESKNEECQEWLENDNLELQSFLKMPNETQMNVQKSLMGSDSDMVRVIDDLIELLIKKQAFVFTELPEAVQVKLNARSKMRQEINPLENLLGESDDIF